MYLKFGNEEEIGKTMSPAKHVLSEVEGTQRRQVTCPRPVIPSECEGSKKDFSLRSK